MGFSGLFSIGVSGLSAYATGLEAVSNNIANSQTVGYRQARTDFSQLVGQTVSDATGTGGDGVAARNRTVHDDQGQIARTQTSTNLAISGNGYFVVTPTLESGANGLDRQFTRAGDFSVNSAGNLVNGSGQILLGTRLNGNQAANFGNLASLQPIDLSDFAGSASASTGIALRGALAATGAINPAVGIYDPTNSNTNLASGAIAPDQRQSVSIFDADGNAQQVTLAFLRLTDNQFAVEAFRVDDTSGIPVASGTLTFASDGSVDLAQSSFPQTISFGGSFQPLALDISALQQSQFSAGLSLAQQGGAPFGSVTGYQIDQNGVLRATLSNGLEELLFQIPLASFTNPEGLARASDTSFRFDPRAGTIELSAAGQSAGGQIEGSAVENSTVDITQAFSTLIQTQRAYAANAQILSVANELYQALNTTAR